MSSNSYIDKEKLQLINLICEESRLKILRAILNSQKDLCVNDVSEVVGLSPSAVSHHFSKLELAHVVESYKIGRKVCYKILDKRMKNLVSKIIKFLN